LARAVASFSPLTPALTSTLAVAIFYPHACQSLRRQVLRLPMSFFDAQPAGRLLNRFSKDTEAADILLRENTAYWISETCAHHPYLIHTLEMCTCPAQALLLISTNRHRTSDPELP